LPKRDPFDRRVLLPAIELEVVDIFGEWKLGDRELVLDRAGLFLADLGAEQIADNTLRLMLGLMAVAMISSKAAFIP
jgi:hypothetical protein